MNNQNTYKVSSKYQNWTPWKSLMAELTTGGMSHQKAAKVADAEMVRRTNKMKQAFVNAETI